MRAVIQTEYGIDAMRIDEVPIPEPREGQVRVRIAAASINPADWHRANGEPKFMRLTEGLRRPKRKRAGLDFAGTIDAVGEGVNEWHEGDAVYGITVGSFAEYAIVETNRMSAAPRTMSSCEAAALPVAAVTSLQAAELGEVAGKRVVVNGASGGVGHLAVQIAKAEGAAEVIAVCSGRNVDWVRDLGADRVIDYDEEDFTEVEADVVIDCVGNRTPREIASGLVSDGHWIVVGATKKRGLVGPLGSMVRAKLAYLFSSRRCVVFVAKETTERLARIAELVDAGHVRVRIAASRPLGEIRDAFDRIESQRTAGKIVVKPWLEPADPTAMASASAVDPA